MVRDMINRQIIAYHIVKKNLIEQTDKIKNPAAKLRGICVRRGCDKVAIYIELFIK